MTTPPTAPPTGSRPPPPGSRPPPRRLERPWLLLVGGYSLTLLFAAQLNPWHLAIVSAFDQPLVLGGLAAVAALAWLVTSDLHVLVRVLTPLVLAAVVLPIAFFAALVSSAFSSPPLGSRTLSMPDSDVRVQVTEIAGIPGKRYDTFTLVSGDGLTRREHVLRGVGVRSDLVRATVELQGPDAFMVHECYHRETLRFDPVTLDIIEHTRVALPESERPETLPPGDLTLPFATDRPTTAIGCGRPRR